jgi:hypothetical protein
LKIFELREARKAKEPQEGLAKAERLSTHECWVILWSAPGRECGITLELRLQGATKATGKSAGEASGARTLSAATGRTLERRQKAQEGLDRAVNG